MLRRSLGSLPLLALGTATAVAGSGCAASRGLSFVNASNFGMRDTRPLDAESNINLPAFVWSPPWNLFGAHLNLTALQPLVASSARGTPYQSGIGQPLLAGQLAQELGNDVGVSDLFGGYLLIETRFLTQNASLSHRFAASYTGDGLNLTANLLDGVVPDPVSPQATVHPNDLNLDLTGTKTFGRSEVDPVTFASTEPPTRFPGYRRQGQSAVGGLVGYNFGPVNLQAYVTQDMVERSDGGRELRGWLRVIVPVDKESANAAAPSLPLGGAGGIARRQRRPASFQGRRDSSYRARHRARPAPIGVSGV